MNTNSIPNQAVIFCGGTGSRLGHHTASTPKPMLTIGNLPIIWHIMKIYYSQGVKEFILPIGYKGEVIVDYFSRYDLNIARCLTILPDGSLQATSDDRESWTIHIVRTGETAQTASRLYQVKDLINGPFFCTYGDGLADVSLEQLYRHHVSQASLATMTVVQPTGRFGVFEADSSGLVTDFSEKPSGTGSWVNGGFFVFSEEVFEKIHQGDLPLESSLLPALASERQLNTFYHHGFWQCVDTPKDLIDVNSIWNSGRAPWKQW
jgi:glucose-1-phosphate cytidylyltransferase